MQPARRSGKKFVSNDILRTVLCALAYSRLQYGIVVIGGGTGGPWPPTFFQGGPNYSYNIASA